MKHMWELYYCALRYIKIYSHTFHTFKTKEFVSLANFFQWNVYIILYWRNYLPEFSLLIGKDYCALCHLWVNLDVEYTLITNWYDFGALRE
jgi:hypothetical protein